MNLDIIKAKLAEMTQKNNGAPKIEGLWRPKPGKHTIRILPYRFDKDNPFVELYFHYGVAGKTYLSPYTFGKPDPILEFSENMLQEKVTKEEFKFAKGLEPKQRVFTPILVRGEESTGPQIWSFSKTIYLELLSALNDPDYGDITDPQNGRDIQIEITEATKPGEFAKTSMRIKPVTCPITNDKNLLATLIQTQKDIKTLYAEVSYEELDAAFKKQTDKWTASDNGTSASGQTKTKDEPTTTTDATVGTTVAETAAVTPEVDTNPSNVQQTMDEFDKLFAE